MCFTFQYLDHEAQPVGEPEDLNLDDFIMSNLEWFAENPAALSAITMLKTGESFVGGGGAGQGFQITRVE